MRSVVSGVHSFFRVHTDIMNEEEIERLARENFSRRIRAILSLREEEEEEEEREAKKRSSTFCSTSPRRNLVPTHAERRRRRTTTSTTKELSSKDKQNDGNSNKDANAVAVLKARKEMARAFQSAAEMLMVKSPSGKKGRREEEEAEKEEEERKMEEIAKRVFAENEKKTRARERLAVVEVMLDVLKDTRREVVVGSER